MGPNLQDKFKAQFIGTGKLLLSLSKLMIILYQRQLIVDIFQQQLTSADTFKIGWIHLKSDWIDDKNVDGNKLPLKNVKWQLSAANIKESTIS